MEGRSGPIAWPPRSPDVTPLDFCFWGYVKDKVYSCEIRDVKPSCLNNRCYCYCDYINVTADMAGTGLPTGYPQGH
ncbi:hypothetical protein AVEN_82167-1 [Araneus ventricosus]|uniref:Uncharacterized protein n=1 Tax=Araneus ventricosus TaxID=182803 RepID=A0A4Y2IUM2_ARAVE|nr:hypothetical protein AVEN_82167-1 [Araneus ventricosus]